jgi:hypothetical protein
MENGCKTDHLVMIRRLGVQVTPQLFTNTTFAAFGALAPKAVLLFRTGDSWAAVEPLDGRCGGSGSS